MADYTYDAMGRRIEKVDAIAGKTTRFYYDDQRIVLEEQTSQGSTAYRWFVYGNYIDEALMFEWQIGGQNTRFYFGHDHLYSPVVMFNNAGIVMERYEYDAYGKVRIFGIGTDDEWFTADDEDRTTSDCGNPYTFTGRELDTLDAGNCALMYYRAIIKWVIYENIFMSQNQANTMPNTIGPDTILGIRSPRKLKVSGAIYILSIPSEMQIGKR